MLLCDPESSCINEANKRPLYVIMSMAMSFDKLSYYCEEFGRHKMLQHHLKQGYGNYWHSVNDGRLLPLQDRIIYSHSIYIFHVTLTNGNLSIRFH